MALDPPISGAVEEDAATRNAALAGEAATTPGRHQRTASPDGPCIIAESDATRYMGSHSNVMAHMLGTYVHSAPKTAT